MDKIIILSELSKTIAELTECSAVDAENFVRELFILAAERLETDGEVYIPEVGMFKLTDESVKFAPDAELAAAVNAPFAAFEAVELPDDFESESESVQEECADSDAEEGAPVVSVSVPEQEMQLSELPDEPENVSECETAQIAEIEPKQEDDDAERNDLDAVQTDVSASDEDETSGSKRRSYGWIVWLAICALCFVAGWYLGSKNSEVSSSETVIETSVDAQDGINVDAEEEYAEQSEELLPEPNPEPESVSEPIAVITDTIVPGRFLTTMARQYYGQMDYWVYIYEENAANLGHPDRLGTGTVVVIPPAEKYGLVAGDAVKISEASRLAREIYERFN